MRVKTVSLKSKYNFPEEMAGLCDQAQLCRLDRNPGVLDRLKALGYDGIRLPVDNSLMVKEQSHLRLLQNSQFEVTAFTCLSYLEDQKLTGKLLSLDKVEILIDCFDNISLERAGELADKNVLFSVIIHQGVAKSKNLDNFFQLLPKIHLYFPYPSVYKKGLTPKGIAKFLDRKLQAGFHDKLAPPYVPLYDPRCVEDTREEYLWEPVINSTEDAWIPEYSVIIPCYNNYPYLKKMLNNFIRQTIDYRDYEIVVVDDGSDQTQAEEFRGWVEEFSKNGCQLKYIYSPRMSPRAMGDGRYRAGISRNLGVSHARGNILCFLDSDILVPNDYLRRVGEELQAHDVVQCRRWDLSAQASDRKSVYSDIVEDDVIFEDEYWDKFHSDQTDWSGRSDGWKYTCTHSLSMRTRDFKESGWILPCFIYYGFEDTELGYRLWGDRLKFCLSEIKVFHLYHKPERSEFLREKWKREKILSKTAEIFFRHQPNPKIFKMFEGYLR